MTPQEIERTIEFILQTEARTAAHLEQQVQRQGEMQAMIALMTELAEVQSQRLDRHDEDFRSMHQWQRDTQQWQQDAQEWQREALARLDQILKRLT